MLYFITMACNLVAFHCPHYNNFQLNYSFDYDASLNEVQVLLFGIKQYVLLLVMFGPKLFQLCPLHQ